MLKFTILLFLSINVLYSQGIDDGLNQMVSQISESMPSSSKQKIAIIEFSDLDGKVIELGKFLSEELITKLFMTKKFNVVERQLLNKILQEHQINMSGIVDENTIKELGKILGVDAICTGTITDLGEKVKLNGRLISTETGSVFSVAFAMIDKDNTITRLMSKTSAINNFQGASKQSDNNDLFFLENFSSIEEGYIPDGWISQNNSMVKQSQKKKGSKVLSSFNGRVDVFQIRNIPFPEDWQFEIEVLGWSLYGITLGSLDLHLSSSDLTVYGNGSAYYKFKSFYNQIGILRIEKKVNFSSFL